MKDWEATLNTSEVREGHIPVVGLLTENERLRQAVLEALSPRVAVVYLNPVTRAAPSGGLFPERLQALLVDAACLKKADTMSMELQGKEQRVLVIVDQAELAGDRSLDRIGRDFVVWPFLPAELRLRVHALLEQAAHADQRIVVGPIAIDLERLEVTAAGRSVRLTPKEFFVLRELALRRGRPVSRQELLNAVWGWNSDRVSNVVDVVVRSLRKKLEPTPFQPRYILTVRGIGYRLARGELHNGRGIDATSSQMN